ncbi:MAG: alpha/beta fold hydrolase [Pyrinomonadaceae bacterium]
MKRFKMMLIILCLITVGAGVALRVYTERLVRQAEARYPPPGQFISVEGVRLHYVSKGTGRPVVLVHGGGGSVYDWTMSVFDRMARDYHVVAFDRPGFGYSERPLGGAPAMTQARLIHTAVKALGIEKPVLVGHSRGGIVATAYALQYPEDVAGIITLGTEFFGEGDRTPLPIRIVRVPVLGSLLVHTVFVPFGGGGVEDALRETFSPETAAPPLYIDAYVSIMLRPKQLEAVADEQRCFASDIKQLVPRYGEITVPFLVVSGQEDANTSISHGRRFHDVVRTSRLVELPNTGHEIMFEHPDMVTKWVANTLAQ